MHGCRWCSYTSPNSSKVRRHERRHTGEKPFKCTVCGQAFAQKGTLTRHFRRHTGERPFKCQECGQAFAASSDLTVHLRVHSGAKPYACPCCHKRFSESGSMRQHVRAVHVGLRPHQCHLCGHRFTRRSSLKSHLVRHSGVKRFRCGDCPGEWQVAFYTSYELSQHWRQVHCTARPFQCQYCAYACKTRGALKRHENTHTRTVEYKCLILGCGKKTLTMRHQHSHKRTHFGVTRVRCSVCAKAFKETKTLTYHERLAKRVYCTRSGSAGWAGKQCSFCLSSFKSRADLGEHVRYRHTWAATVVLGAEGE